MGTFQIFIDSRDRDVTKWPRACTYDVFLDPRLQNVHSLKLVASNIPHAPLVGDMASLLVRSNENQPWTTYSLGSGDFGSAVDVQTNFQRFSCPLEVDEVPLGWAPGQDESVTSTGLTRKVLRFSSSSAFDMRILDERLSRVLGFGAQLVTATAVQILSGQWVVTAPHTQDTQFYIACVGIVLDSDDFKSPIGVEGAAMRDAFAIVTCNASCYGNHNAYDKAFEPPLARVTRLRVKLIDRLGQLYDTGKDHSFQLQVIQR